MPDFIVKKLISSDAYSQK